MESSRSLPPVNIVELCRGAGDIDAGIAFSTLARDTFQKVGWPPVTPFHGCNWKTPITEGSHYEKTPWTSMLHPDTEKFIPKGNSEALPPTRMRVFHRQPTKTVESIHKSKSIKVLLFRQTDTHSSITVTIPKETGITAGTTVQIVCEVMLDSTQHPTPWARLPDVGPFSWKIINSLGWLFHIVKITAILTVNRNTRRLERQKQQLGLVSLPDGLFF
jgi:hypothetical protein